ncbi:HAUS augmin-like complex subunit 2 isoform 2 [Camelus ferus]|nr:HAUS augmin-like complex subunit 2 isoform 2 [Camelus ferus]
MAAANPWDPASAPNAAGLLLGHFVASGVVTQVCGGDGVNKGVHTVATEDGSQKCHTLQSMNNHLEVVLKEKRSLRQRLLKPMCQENLPIEAVYHRYMVHLLELAVTFIERLENHLETIRNIPHVDANLKKMSMALAKMDILVTETEELAENILKWREQQEEVSSSIPKIIAEENFLHNCDVIISPLPFTSKVSVQTINTK